MMRKKSGLFGSEEINFQLKFLKSKDTKISVYRYNRLDSIYLLVER